MEIDKNHANPVTYVCLEITADGVHRTEELLMSHEKQKMHMTIKATRVQITEGFDSTQ